jgi:hypothetical protein
MNVYYDGPYEGVGGKPPTCVSADAVTGIGEPGGECAVCPLNVFKPGKNGKPEKACKNKYRILLLQEGNYLPSLMYVTSSNLKACKTFRTKQLTQGRRLQSIVTTITMGKKGDRRYAALDFKRVRDLTADERAVIDPYAAKIKEYAGRIAFDADIDAETDDAYTTEVIDPETGEVTRPLAGGN